MSDFKFKMHKNRFRLGLRPRPRRGSLQPSPDPLAGFKGTYFEGEGGEGKGGERNVGLREYGGREGKDRGGRGGERRGGEEIDASGRGGVVSTFLGRGIIGPWQGAQFPLPPHFNHWIYATDDGRTPDDSKDRA